MFPRILIIYASGDEVDDLKSVLKDKYGDLLEEKEKPYTVPCSDAVQFVSAARPMDLTVFTETVPEEIIESILHLLDELNHRSYTLQIGSRKTASSLKECVPEIKNWPRKEFKKTPKKQR